MNVLDPQAGIFGDVRRQRTRIDRQHAPDGELLERGQVGRRRHVAQPQARLDLVQVDRSAGDVLARQPVRGQCVVVRMVVVLRLRWVLRDAALGDVAGHLFDHDFGALVHRGMHVLVEPGTLRLTYFEAVPWFGAGPGKPWPLPLVANWSGTNARLLETGAEMKNQATMRNSDDDDDSATKFTTENFRAKVIFVFSFSLTMLPHPFLGVGGMFAFAVVEKGGEPMGNDSDE